MQSLSAFGFMAGSRFGTLPTVAIHDDQGDDAEIKDLERLLHRNEESVARIRAMIQDLKKRIDAEKSGSGGADADQR